MNNSLYPSLPYLYNSKYVNQQSFSYQFTHPLNPMKKNLLYWYCRKNNIFASTLLNSDKQIKNEQDNFHKQILDCPAFTSIYQMEGLPNIGNTCFINSFMQLLFSSKKFRLMMLVYPLKGRQKQKSSQNQKMNESSLKIKKLNAISIIQELFWAMLTPYQKDPNIKLKKRIIMQKVVQLFETEQASQGQEAYTRYSQQDSFMYLLNIITIIKKEDPQLTEIFKFSFMKICTNQSNHDKRFTEGQNGKRQIVTQKFQNQYILQSPHDYCGEHPCLQGLKLQQNQFVFLEGSPEALLMTNNQFSDSAQYSNELWYFQLTGVDNFSTSIEKLKLKLIHYQRKAKLMYSGNRRNGHCIAIRKIYQQNIVQDSNQFYVFDDSFIQKNQSYIYRRFNDKAFLYEKTNVIQLKFQQIINHLKVNHYEIQQSKQKDSQFIGNNQRFSNKNQHFNKLKLLQNFKYALSHDQTIIQKLFGRQNINILADRFFHVIKWIFDRLKINGEESSTDGNRLLKQVQIPLVVQKKQIQQETSRRKINNQKQTFLKIDKENNNTFEQSSQNQQEISLANDQFKQNSPNLNKQQQHSKLSQNVSENNHQQAKESQNQTSHPHQINVRQSNCCSPNPMKFQLNCHCMPSFKNQLSHCSDPEIESYFAGHGLSHNIQVQNLMAKVREIYNKQPRKVQMKQNNLSSYPPLDQLENKQDQTLDNSNKKPGNMQKGKSSNEKNENNSNSTQEYNWENCFCD